MWLCRGKLTSRPRDFAAHISTNMIACWGAGLAQQFLPSTQPHQRAADRILDDTMSASIAPSDQVC